MRLQILLFFLTASLATTLPAKPLPLEKLYGPATLSGLKISPDGSRLAITVLKDDQQHIGVMSLTDLSLAPVARLGPAVLVNLWWANDDRILVLIDDPNDGIIYKSIEISTGKATTHFSGHYRDHWLIHELPDQPDKVLMAYQTANYTGYELREFDLIRNRTRVVEKNPGQVQQWLLNAKGEVVAAVELTSEQLFLLHRTTSAARWTKIPYGTPEEPVFEFMAVHPDQRRLLALDYTTDPARLVAVDPVTMATESLFAPERFDPSVVESWGKLGGMPQSVIHPAETTARHHLSQISAALQREIDRSLPDTFNSIRSISRDEEKLVIFTANAQSPGFYYLLDRPSGRLMPLGPSIGGIEPATLGRNQPFNFATSDGLNLQGEFLAPPKTEHPPPMVLLLEEDVFRRREGLIFSSLRQAFASRGYAVASIDYRGTKGYGHGFVLKGRHQIANRIPLDLIEGVQWLGQQGWIDPNRVIVMGTYDAGWVAMHTLARPAGSYAGWINISTPVAHEVDIDTVKPFYVVPDWSPWRDLVELKHSGIIQAPSPVKLLAQINVPAFHFSPGEHVRRDVRRNSRTAVIVDFNFTRRMKISDPRMRSAAVYEKLFAFLAEHFPTEQNSRPPSADGRN
ncbi:MAG TPA: prolyl oligopeptidase family serine peptidase [Opitutaceae bacterium]|nr:prolyl oligopeptidase family serine peptidase [Opitutaceae bacterium]HRJ47316.1 prolyl oligopeptidase family serine peptidase [Opitutaceae bacterium]